MIELEQPAWFYHGWIEGDLPWNQGKQMSFDQFHSKYTLHDSIWLGMFYDIAFEQTLSLAIHWDAIWLPDEIYQSSSTVRDWPYLFIRIEQAHSVTTDNYGDLKDMQRSIATSENIVVSDQNLLAIDDVSGGKLSITYKGPVTFLAIDPAKRVVSI
ncbi:hypothetical protein [Acaryochloris marina]|uniref:Uncharacterized protein n=1 Tax=Acaryochloris marina (strain MBIC 11017) TaxID=329726 RepID=B0C434_ACAM1|nr:hypothetical protein [Acaryochloris marina]ABW26294.1 hypothetical protein AM1_1257 [Acaryochloris marina MBIC11017]BDM81117.1 hypothetical protein AM10699_39840 [Acaryochloris marina MBIC10699]